MYDKLIKNLRHDSASALQNCEFDFVHDWMLKAADAIEELQKQLDDAEIENIKLKEEFAKYRAKHRWIPVTERLPEIGQEVLVWSYGCVNVYTLIQVDERVLRWRDNYGYYKINEDKEFWMPRPEPPESEDK